MEITPIQPGQLKPIQGTEVFGQPSRIRTGDGTNFGGIMSQAIQSVDEAQKTADTQIENFVMGKTENVHEVMISMERAKLSFQLMMEVRNKMVETYQELSRMHI